jgi:hypothetical protein
LEPGNSRGPPTRSPPLSRTAADAGPPLARDVMLRNESGDPAARRCSSALRTAALTSTPPALAASNQCRNAPARDTRRLTLASRAGPQLRGRAFRHCLTFGCVGQRCARQCTAALGLLQAATSRDAKDQASSKFSSSRPADHAGAPLGCQASATERASPPAVVPLSSVACRHVPVRIVPRPRPASICTRGIMSLH